MWKQGGLFTLEGSCPDGEISVGLKHLVIMFFFLFFFSLHLLPNILSSDQMWLVETLRLSVLKHEGDILSDSISKKTLKAFHLEFLVWKRNNKQAFLLELVECSVFTIVSFLLSLLNNVGSSSHCYLLPVCTSINKLVTSLPNLVAAASKFKVWSCGKIIFFISHFLLHYSYFDRITN